MESERARKSWVADLSLPLSHNFRKARHGSRKVGGAKKWESHGKQAIGPSAAESARKADKQKAERVQKKGKTVARKWKAANKERGDEPAQKRTRHADKNEPPCGSNSQIRHIVDIGASIVAHPADVPPQRPPRPRPLKCAQALSVKYPSLCTISQPQGAGASPPLALPPGQHTLVSVLVSSAYLA